MNLVFLALTTYTLFFLLAILFITLVIYDEYFVLKRIKKLIQNNESKNENTEHIAIIISSKKTKNIESERKRLLCDGEYSLIKYFVRKKIKFKVYLWVNKEKFKEVIKNNNIKIVYIFGHGKRHGIRFENGEYLEYEDIKDYPPKDFVGQYHCNGTFYFLPTWKKSLADHIAKKGDVSHWLRFGPTTALKIWWMCNILKRVPHETKYFDIAK